MPKPVAAPVVAPKPASGLVPLKMDEDDDLEPLPKLKTSGTVKPNSATGVAASIRKTFEPLIDEPLDRVASVASDPTAAQDSAIAEAGQVARTPSKLTLPKVTEAQTSSGLTTGIKIIASEQTRKAVVPENKVKGEYV
ncbi:hypothetical protein RZS08_17590, partial [Arthrospira platensis SPKY1]|nr:hypothetical protein [Arthrospira platensis SPKY1]